MNRCAVGAFVALVAGCGGRIASTDADDAGLADVRTKHDASADAARPVAIRCVRDPDAAPPPPFVAPPGPPPDPHPPQLKHAGGPVLRKPTFVPITFDGDPLRASVEELVGSIGCTEYWRQTMSDYGVGVAIATDPIHVAEPPPAKLSDVAIAAWLRDRIAAKTLPDPPDAVYVVYYPATTSVSFQGEIGCKQFGGYHNELTLPDQTRRAYVVMPRCSGAFDLSDLDELTGTTAHELVEAASDPFPFSQPAYQRPEDDGMAWALAAGGENADLCVTATDAFFRPADYPFTVQRVWSNRAAATTLDPCAPGLGAASFGGAPVVSDSLTLPTAYGIVTMRGVRLAEGAQRTIPFQVFGSPGAITFFVDDLSVSLGAPSSTLKLTLDAVQANPGETRTLTIERTGTGPGGYSLFMVRAGRAGHEQRWFGVVGD